MNLDDDYDSDGNNIVPCPICLNVYCPSKEGGKCPEEDEFYREMVANVTREEMVYWFKSLPWWRRLFNKFEV